MWAIDMVTWFLMLASEMTRAIDESSDEARVTLSRDWRWVLKLLLLQFLNIWNEKWLANMLIRHWPGMNSLLKVWKDRKTSLNLLSILTTDPLIFLCCLGLRQANDSLCGGEIDVIEDSNRNLRMWFCGREWTLSWDLPQSFQKYNLIGMKPTIALMPNEEDVQNAPSIHIATLYCILLSYLIGYTSSTLL